MRVGTRLAVTELITKISKFGTTKCQILRLKCPKFDFCWGSAPDPGEGVYSAAPDPLAVGLFKGPTDEGREREKKGKGMEEEVMKGEVKGFTGPMSNCFLRACTVACNFECSNKICETIFGCFTAIFHLRIIQKYQKSFFSDA